MNRRKFIATIGSALAFSAHGNAALVEGETKEDHGSKFLYKPVSKTLKDQTFTEKVRDRFWLWGHDAGSHNGRWNIPGKSRITPVEAAFYLSIPNIIMVKFNKDSLPPSVQYSVPFRPLKKVVWSIIGAGGPDRISEQSEREEGIKLALDLPNMTGVLMDDFFRNKESDGCVGTLSLDELRHVRDRLREVPRKLDLWVVLYANQLPFPIKKHLELCDKVTFWTWEAVDLDKLDENFALLESVAPSCGKLLGCYMWDYGAGRQIPIDLMKRQCEKGLQWLHEGRIEGMVFLASCICDLGIEAVEWTRHWVKQVGDQPV